MKIKHFILLILAITTVIFAQVDSIGVNSPNLIIKKLRSDDKSLKGTPLNSSGIDSTCASYYKMPKPLPPPPTPFIKNWGIGYLYNMDKNLKFAGHGLSFKLLGKNVGFETYMTHQEFEDSTKRYYPKEVIHASSSSDLPFQESGAIEYISPLLKQTELGLNLIIMLHKNDKSMLYLTIGSGINYKSKKKYYRDYNISSEGSYYTYYNFKYTGAETNELCTSYYGLVTFGLGGSYNLSENFYLSGEVQLKGEKHTAANYSPLPRVALSYMF